MTGTNDWEESGPSIEAGRPFLSAYTTIHQGRAHGYPYLESIRSMLGFADEVVVVDGGSTDGTYESIRDLGDPRVKLVQNPYDPKFPPMDGFQKQIARSLCTGRYLWQQDADEVLHEDQTDLVRRFCLEMPAEVDLIALPVIELWGDRTQVRTGTHSWKWRLSRRNPDLVHGINVRARRFTKDGIPFALPGQSDGCEYISATTGEFFPFASYWTPQFEDLRRNNHVQYGQVHNKLLFRQMPSVFHYSWCDLRRKVRNHRDFWDGQWNALYQQEVPRPFFPEKDLRGMSEAQLDHVALRLYSMGDPRFQAPTFPLEMSHPRVMEGWLSEHGL